MKEHLTEGERILYSTKISRRSKISGHVLILILLIAALALYVFYPPYSYLSLIPLALGAFLFFAGEISLFGRRFYVTNYAVSERTGLLSKRVRSVDMDDIINITVTQGIWNRMLGYGEIHINTSETEKEEEIIFPSIANPYGAKKVIEENMRRHHRVPLRKADRHLNYPKTK